MNKATITKVCIDDFALKKREKYGTIMVDIETHRVIDLLDSRDLNQVVQWLNSYPNLEVVSRDGSITYRKAIGLAHPRAMQVSDRFHLLKNLTDYCKDSLKRLLPTRIAISSEVSQADLTPAVLEKANSNRKLTLEEKYRKALELKTKGQLQTEICQTLNLNSKVFQKLMNLTEAEADSYFSTSIDEKQALTRLRKMEDVALVRRLHEDCNSVRNIAKLTGFSRITIARYLDENFSPVRKESTRKGVSILTPYIGEINAQLDNGKMVVEIEKTIREQGYCGAASTLRRYCTNWKKSLATEKQLAVAAPQNTTYILRKDILKLIYWPISKVPALSEMQWVLFQSQHPKAADVLNFLDEFRTILKEQLLDKLIPWMDKIKHSEIPELYSFVNGVERDLAAVQHAILFPYNNGLAEGSVNKLKVIKRIMYGRCSFGLLKAKLLRLEKIRNFN